jgi:ketosteroid isomerase-like protein
LHEPLLVHEVARQVRLDVGSRLVRRHANSSFEHPAHQLDGFMRETNRERGFRLCLITTVRAFGCGTIGGMRAQARELVAAGADAVTRRNSDALIAVCADDVEFEPSMAGLEVQVYRGHAGMREWMADLHAVWSEFSGVLDELTDVGPGRVLVRFTVHGRARQSDVSLEQRFWHLWAVRDGKLWRGQSFTGEAEALRAAGRDGS